jgi:hypothetical protein
MITIIGFSLVLIFIIYRIIYYKLYIKPEKLRYEQKLFSLFPEFVKDYDFKETFHNEINNYFQSENIANKVECNIKKLPFPIPAEPNPIEKSDNIMKKLTTVFDDNSLIWVGTEQIILEVFPPEQIGNCIIYAIENITINSSQATIDTLASLKSSVTEGISNIQDPTVIVDCLKHLGVGIVDNLHNPMHAHSFIDGIEHENYGKILSSFSNWHSITTGLDPAMNLNQHFSEIGLSWSNHIHESVNNIGDHLADTLHPDPTGHFPFVTLIMSSIREMNLISENKTSIENSLKNVSLDVTGAGLGAIGGAKLGAIIGTTFGPAGIVVGGLIGSVAGAIGGRALTNEIKYIPLKTALNDYRLNFDKMLVETKNHAVISVNSVRTAAINNKNKFINDIGVAPQLDREKSEIKIICKRLLVYLNKELKDYIQQISSLKNSKFASNSKYRKIIKSYEMEVGEIITAIPSEKHIDENPISAFHKIINLPHFRNGKYQNELKRSFDNIVDMIKNHRTILLIWSFNASNFYKKAINNIAMEVKTQAESYNKKCLEWERILDDQENVVKNEKNKLGIV